MPNPTADSHIQGHSSAELSPLERAGSEINGDVENPDIGPIAQTKNRVNLEGDDYPELTWLVWRTCLKKI
jgi:hypothetical protein